MGTFLFTHLIVDGFDYDEDFNTAYEVLKDKVKIALRESDHYVPNWKNVLSPKMSTISNVGNTFYLSPDGSKLGWTTNQEFNMAREEFVQEAMDKEWRIKIYEVIYGDRQDPHIQVLYDGFRKWDYGDE